MSDPDETIAVCASCQSDQPDSISNTALFKAGILPTCRFCGGNCMIIRRGDRADAIAQYRRMHGM